jgi:hypothetical protein
MFNMSKENEDWFSQKLTIEDTKAVSLEYIEQERRD